MRTFTFTCYAGSPPAYFLEAHKREKGNGDFFNSFFFFFFIQPNLTGISWMKEKALL